MEQPINLKARFKIGMFTALDDDDQVQESCPKLVDSVSNIREGTLGRSTAPKHL